MVRVKDGYLPPEESKRYVAPRPRRFRGACVEYDAKLHYGFIRPDDLSPNLFVHRSWIIEESRELKPGDIVEFERHPPPEGDKHDRAMNVRLVNNLQQLSEQTNRASTPKGGSNSSLATLVPRVIVRSEVEKRRAQKRAASSEPALQKPERKPKHSASGECSVLGYL